MEQQHIINRDVRKRNVSGKNAELIPAMENLAGQFAAMYNFGCTDGIETLFMKDGVLELPDFSVRASGREEIRNLFAGRALKEDTGDIHVLHTPSFAVMNTDDEAKGTWDTCSYRIYCNEGMPACEIMITRMDVWFAKGEDGLKIRSLNWHIMQSWVPVNYAPGQETPLKDLQKKRDFLPEGETPSAGDYTALQNLLGRFVHDHFRNPDELFADRPDTCLFLDCIMEKPAFGFAETAEQMEAVIRKEKETGHYVVLCSLAGPVIVLTGENTARAVSALACYVPTKEEEKEGLYLERSIRLLKADFVKEEECWKILSLQTEDAAQLPYLPKYTPSFGFERMSLKEGNWTAEEFGTAQKAGDCSGDAFIAENIVNAWIYATRSGKDMEFLDNYVNFGALPCVFDFKSRGLDAPSLETEEAVKEKISVFDRQWEALVKQPAYHAAGTPYVRISADGQYMKALWIDCCNTNMSAAFGKYNEDGTVPYMAAVNKYMYEFRKKDGVWYLVHWYFEPLMNVMQHSFNPKNSRGWCMKDDGRPYQQTEEEYE